jgi:ATP-dependent Lon protease
MFNKILEKINIKTEENPHKTLEIDTKLKKYFSGKIVNKGLTKQIKTGNNVPVFVLEYILGTTCTDNSNKIETVKSDLSKYFIRLDEAEKIKSRIRETGQYTIIDKLTVRLDEKKDIYLATFASFGISNVEVDSCYVCDFDKLLEGIWCKVRMGYDTESENSPFIIQSLNPLQIPTSDVYQIIESRKYFSKSEWIDVLIRSVGLEPKKLPYPVKWHILERLVPYVENNYNLCELGPRSTGKSYIYKEISSNSVLVSGGQTTVPNLYYNMTTRSPGLIGSWDVIAFDEVAGINFKDKDLTQIMKDYMASGSFSRGKEVITAVASMVMVGNINNSVEDLLQTSNLFAPFPKEINTDTAFFDRIHYYLPGWEIPKFRPYHFTEGYGFMVDYIAEFFREMRKQSFSDYLSQYFWLGDDLNQRDVQAVKKTFSGLMKLLYPDELFTKEDAREVLEYAMVGRRRVKEQLKIIGGDEFKDVNFYYTENGSRKKHIVNVPENRKTNLKIRKFMNIKNNAFVFR